MKRAAFKTADVASAFYDKVRALGKFNVSLYPNITYRGVNGSLVTWAPIA